MTVWFYKSDFRESNGLQYTQPFRISEDTIYISCALDYAGYVSVETKINGVWIEVPLSTFYCDLIGVQGFKECNLNSEYRLKSTIVFNYAKIIM